MRFRHQGFALPLAFLLASAGAFAQGPKDDESIMRVPMAGPEFVIITRVDPDGTIVLGPSDSAPPQVRDILGTYYAEGLYLLVTNDSKPASAAACFACRSPTWPPDRCSL